MTLRLRSLFYLLFLFLFAGCGNGNDKTQGNSAASGKTEKGKVVRSVSCLGSADVSYALYVPGNYSSFQKFPVIIAFDPHGDGSLPVVNYRNLAEKYGYVLMGSNNSKNGQDMNTTTTIIDALFSEARTRYSIDSSRIYVMGFSGGARVASMIGFFQGGVAGVIGCGAGLPYTSQPVRFRPDYIGMAGNADFNMNELISLDQQMEKAKFPHALILFDGKHGWPPAGVMENAFIWTEFCSMRNHLIPKNDSMIRDYTRLQESFIKKDLETGDRIAEHDHLLNLIRFTDALTPTDDLRKRLSGLENSPAYRMSLQKQQERSEKEMKDQQSLNENFFSKGLDWWKQKISAYDSRINRGKDSSDVRMCKRLKSYLSLLCYMNYKRMVSANDSISARHAMEIYQAVDPENAALTKAGKAD